MLVVSDTSAITNLININQLDVLKHLFNDINIPTKVYEELAHYEKQKKEIECRSWIVVKKVSNVEKVKQLMTRLDTGEAEAIVLAHEMDAAVLIIDERKGRKVAEEFGLKIIGLLGILISAKRHGYIEELKPILNELIERVGFRVGEKLYKRVLKEVNEI